MKKSYLLCTAIGLALCTTAWLLGLLINDVFIFDDDWEVTHELALEDIEFELNQSNSTEYVVALEQEYNAVISLLNSDDISGDKSNDISTNQELQTLSDAELYVLTLDNGGMYEVALETPATGWFSDSELLTYFLQCIALLASLWISKLILQHQLRNLDTATVESALLNDAEKADDPISAAIKALYKAKEHINKLQIDQKDAIDDHKDLLASVAHEFRNPLARLQFANEMAMERTGDEQKALFEEANNAAIELDALVRETLRYSRLRSMGNKLALETHSVNSLLSELAEPVQATNANIRLSIIPAPTEWEVLVDKRLMVRALSNLAINAMKYANSKVTIEASNLEHGIEINVVDDGPGIAAIHQDRIFEPFYRVESSRSRDSGGFGLGLSIVKSICDQHDAVVKLVSDGHGCKFTIVFNESDN